MTATEIFEKLCPTYIVYGMTWEQFWYGDPHIAQAYREAYMLKRKVDNEEAWISGLYVYNAFGAVLTTAFSKHQAKYVERPFDIFPKTKEEKKIEERNEKKKLVAFLDSFKKKHEGTDKQ